MDARKAKEPPITSRKETYHVYHDHTVAVNDESNQ
jgi:hypothetical protein